MHIQTQAETFSLRIASLDLDEYRNVRHQQEVALEGQTGGYGADEAHYRAKGGPAPITLQDWMRGKKIGPGEQKARQAPVSHDVYIPDPHAWGGEAPSW